MDSPARRRRQNAFDASGFRERSQSMYARYWRGAGRRQSRPFRPASYSPNTSRSRIGNDRPSRIAWWKVQSTS